jgi:hypothetical protein
MTITTKTEYPKKNTVRMEISLAVPEQFTLRIRNPYWCKKTSLLLNGAAVNTTEGYIEINHIWKSGDTLELALDFRVFALRPIPYGSQVLMNKVVWGANSVVPTFDREDPLAKHHIAYRRGPLMLAQENRLGYSVDDPIDPLVNADETVAVRFPVTEQAPYPHIIELEIPLKDGSYQTLTDYASAGKLWTEESKMAVWFLTK